MAEIIASDEQHITKPWSNLMTFIQTSCPNGDVTIKFAKGQPAKLLSAKPDIRFDQEIAPINLINM